MNLRDKIKNIVQDISSCEGVCFSDEFSYKEADVILSLLRTAVEEAKPKPKMSDPFTMMQEVRIVEIQKTGVSTPDMGAGYNKSLSDYHSALMEKLK